MNIHLDIQDSDFGDSFTSSGSIGACVHPMVTVTQTNSYTDAKIEKSTDSSPSHSQMSRSSSKKSNNSLLVTNGKLEGMTCCHLPYMLFRHIKSMFGAFIIVMMS